MLFRNRLVGIARFVVVLSAVLLMASCFQREEIAIPPQTESRGQSDIGLGPGVRPISAGLGEKGSPAWSPSGDRIAFTMDGYVVEKSPTERAFERRTTKDFRARTVAWTTSGEDLAILGADAQSGITGTRLATAPLGVYRTIRDEGSLDVSKVSGGVQAMVPGPPESDWVLLATEDGDSSRLALMKPGGDVQPYDARVEGDITGVSVSPDGNRAALAVRSSDRFDIYAFSLPNDEFQRVARLEEGLEVFGAPQWTEQGVYYVAGEEQEAGEPDAAPFDLYRVPRGSSTPERAPGVGDDFVASNLARDPEGERLAVIGRRNPGSAQNLYMLDLGSETLEAVTRNEDMQIKTGAQDLGWSGDGNSVVIVARSVLSEPEVYSAPADTLVKDFYNLYEVPTTETTVGG